MSWDGALAKLGDVRRGDLPFVTPEMYGAVGDGVANDTVALQMMFATGGTKFEMRGRYKVSWAQQTAFQTFTGMSSVEVIGGGRIVDVSTYTVSPANPFSAFLVFDGCDGAKVVLGYEGPAIATPETNHGYVGATFVRAINGNKNLSVDADIINCRYGVSSGSYDNHAVGNCDGIAVNLRCNYVGYPIALYLAKRVSGYINAADAHRAAYLGGVQGGQLRVDLKNQWIANCCVLMTDALDSASTSIGCSNLDVDVNDLGSSRTEATFILAGILHSRPAHASTFRSIRARVNSVATNSISQNVSAFQIYSSAWTSSHKLHDISISGRIDKSAQTSGQATGVLYISTNTGGSAAEVKGFRLDGLVKLPSSGETTTDYVHLLGLVGEAYISNCSMDGLLLQVVTNANAPVIVSASSLGNVECQTPAKYIGSTVKSLTSTSWGLSQFVNTLVNSGGLVAKTKATLLALSGASTTWTAAVPPGAIVVGMTGVIRSEITGATGFQVGVTGALSRYANKNSLNVGFRFNPADHDPAMLSPLYSGGANVNIVVTAKTSNFTGGSIELMVVYYEIAAVA